MAASNFERFAVHQNRLHVSVCRACLRFIAAAPDAISLAIPEQRHACCGTPKKPPASVTVGEARYRAEGPR